MFRTAALSLTFPLATACIPAQVNHQALEDIAAGRLQKAKASWWGFEATDATACLQAAIDSRVPRLIVDHVGKPWIVRPIQLVSNQEIVFEKGVEVLAKADEFKGGNDSLFTGRLVENVSLIGYGATLRMRRADYADPSRYRKAEWRHIVQFFSSRNIKIYGLTLAESGGDGIYLGTAERGITNQNVHIKDVICDRNYRQGLSVITAEDLLIENTILRDTAGTPPMAGIDFEPNNADEGIVNCVMRNCVAENNNGWGYVAYLAALQADSAPVSLRLENCRAIGNQAGGFAFITGSTEATAVRGQVSLINCEFTRNGGPAFSIGGNPPPPIGCHIAVQGCSFLDNAVDQPTQAPILFSTPDDAAQDVGGVKFIDVLVRDPVARPPMAFVDMAAGFSVSDVNGNLILEEGDQKRNVELTGELLGKWMPVMALKEIPRVSVVGRNFEPLQPLPAGHRIALGNWHLRQTGTACVWARQGEAVTVTINSSQIGQYVMNPVVVGVISPAGREIMQVEVPFGQESPIAFVAQETGLYILRSDAGANCAFYTTSTHPLNLGGASGAVHLIGSTGTLFCYVPPGTKEFGIRLRGEGGREGLKATLLNPAGEFVAEKDNIVRTDMLSVELPQPSPGEIWSLKLEKPSAVVMEDYFIDLLGIPPLWAPRRECLLRPVK